MSTQPQPNPSTDPFGQLKSPVPSNNVTLAQGHTLLAALTRAGFTGARLYAFQSFGSPSFQTMIPEVPGEGDGKDPWENNGTSLQAMAVPIDQPVWLHARVNEIDNYFQVSWVLRDLMMGLSLKEALQ